MKHPLLVLVLGAAACASTTDSGSPDAAAIDVITIDAAPFTPNALPGISLWLDGTRGVFTQAGAQVVNWVDQSPAHNSAVGGTGKPLYISGIANGLPALRFDGQTTYVQLPDSATLQFGTGDYTVEVVAAVRNVASTNGLNGYALLYDKSLQTTPFAGVSMFQNYPVPAASTTFGTQCDSNHYIKSTRSGLNDGNLHVFGARRTSGTLEVRVDGATQGTTSVTGIDSSALGAKPTVGGQAKIVQMLNGDVAEVVAVKGTLSDAQIGALETFLKQKYGVQ